MKSGKEALFFTRPSAPKQRLYEALRAVFVDGMRVKDAAKKFGYTPKTLYVQMSRFRAGELGPFFVESRPGPKHRRKGDPLRETIIRLRKKNYSIYDISRVLRERKRPLSPRAVAEILQEAGFARLPRRLDEERPQYAKPIPAPKANRKTLSLRSGQVIDTQVAGLFLFIPFLVDLGIHRAVSAADYPGTKMIPPLQYVLSLLALKLLGRERYSHVMDCCHDLGLGLFAGLNAIPKTTALTTYSYRIVRKKNLRFLKAIVRGGPSRKTTSPSDSTS